MNNLYLKQFSSLEKIFLDEEPKGQEISKASSLKGEEFSYQIAYSKIVENGWAEKAEVKISVNSEISPYITVRRVMCVPGEMTAFPDGYDDGYYTTKSGLFPDVLMPIENNKVYAGINKWHSLWVSVDVPKDAKPGIYDIEIIFEDKDGAEKSNFQLEIIDRELIQQDLIFTQWFHSDCIAGVHNVEIFSKEHWELIEKYIQTAAFNGINMLLTPVFTPPLDTQIGGERPTVQLVDCYFDNGKYSFDFEKLERWVLLCQKHGIKYFEISHLFTQWGAKYAPKIEVVEKAAKIKKFGWHTSADDKEYVYFLKSFLPELTHFLKTKGIDKYTYFHISDEPMKEHLDSYKKAHDLVIPYIKDFKKIDALSSFEFYQNGLVEIPIPANDHIDKFLDCDIPERWTYYCCAQGKKVSNRFFAMPSTRNRIIGAQLYKFDIQGFLHWGYNFYFSQYSKEVINPYITTDAAYGFPAGDSFSVYPYKNSVAESIRLKIFKEALQDLRAMKMLEDIKGKDYVLKIIEEECGCELKFDQFPFWGDYVLSYRKRINDELKAN